MNLKRMNLKYLAILLVYISVACSSDDDEVEYENDERASSFDGVARGNSVSFVIGDKGYFSSRL